MKYNATELYQLWERRKKAKQLDAWRAFRRSCGVGYGGAAPAFAARGVASLLGDGRRRAALALLLMFELARRLAAWLEDVAAYYIYLHSNTW